MKLKLIPGYKLILLCTFIVTTVSSFSQSNITLSESSKVNLTSGKWYLHQMQSGSDSATLPPEMAIQMYMFFKPDGKFEWMQEGEKISGTWSLKGKRITVIEKYTTLRFDITSITATELQYIITEENGNRTRMTHLRRSY